MKKLLLLLISLCTAPLYAQEYSMSNGSISDCSGIFYDSGGSDGTYSNEESYVYTICSEYTDGEVQVNFIDLDIQENVDFLYIYDGSDTSADLMATLTGTEATPALYQSTNGCLTFEFIADDEVTGTGWQANLSCYVDCQSIEASVITDAPTNSDGIVEICQGTTVNFSGSALFQDDDTGATYSWDFGDDDIIDGNTASYTFNEEGVYVVWFTANDTNGCNGSKEQIVYVSTTPDFSFEAESEICLGETNTITATVTPVEGYYECAPPVSETTFLPDGSGASYSTSIEVTCYAEGATITNIDQFGSVCLNIEHSYLGDLDIELVSPNGQSVMLKQFSDGGGGIFLGEALDDNGTDPGVGYTYCFSDEGTTTLVDGDTVATGGDTPGTAIEPGTYLPSGDLDNLLGSPLNGDWTIIVTDNLSIDNGYIFSWSVSFDSSNLPEEYAFTPFVVENYWTVGDDIVGYGDTIDVTPTEVGSYCYTYNIVDDFGCEYTEDFCFDANQNPEFFDTPEYVQCMLEFEEGEDGYGEFDLTSMESYFLAGQTGFLVTYYESAEDAEDQVNAITVPESYVNTTAYEQTIYVRLENELSGCYTTGNFEIKIDILPDIPEISIEVCDEVSLDDGIEVFDLTIENDNILDVDSPYDYTILFYENETDAEDGDPDLAITNPEAFSNTVANEQTVYLRIENDQTGCYKVESIDLTVYALPQITPPTPLYGCDSEPFDGYYQFMLTEKNAEILNGQENISVSYFESEADYLAGEIPLNSAYTNIQTPSQTLFVVLENVLTGCIDTTTLDIIVTTPPVAETPDALEFCDADNDGYGYFDIESMTDMVTPQDGETYIVTYHVTLSDAETNVNTFTSPYENIYPDNQTIYVRVENATTGCFDVVPLELIVNPTPVIIPNLDPLEICDDSVVDGLAEFDLSLANDQVYGTQSNADFTISYHTTEVAAQADEDALPTYYTNINAFAQTIYVRLEDNVTGCYTIRPLDLIVHPNPVINPNYDNDLALCDDFGEDGDETLVFDLTVENAEVTGGIDGYMVMYYETSADAQNNTNQIIPDTAYTNLENPQTIFVRVEDALTGCTSFTTVTLRVLNNPTPLFDIEPLEACDDNDDGDENNGQTIFDLTVDELALLNGEDGVTPTYYESYDDAFAGTNAISNPENYYNVSQYNQTIYVAVTNDATGCLTITDFELIVHPLPEVTEEPVYYLCELDNNDVEVIPVSDMNSFVLDYGDATDLEITYHTTEAYAEAGTHEIVGSITVNGTMTIYARVEDVVTGCAQTLGYEIDIEQAPLAGQPEVYALCESLTEDGYYNNDGVEIFDLTSLEETILDGQDPNGYTVSFYETYDNALAQMSAIDEEDAIVYESAGQIIYAVVTNNDTGCTNGEPIEIELIVEPMPEVTLELRNDGIICIDATNNPIIGTDLGSGYTYEWNTGVTTPTIEVTQGGEYFVTVTNTNSINQCSYTSNSVIFEEASLPSVTPTIIQSEIFSGNNTIEVIANGAGTSEYEYQLDDNPSQDSGLFTNVEPGVHTVTITEVNGCGSLTIEVSVVDYMKYFTPNGDGVNDTWRIIGLESQENAQVFIFDRQGKLLKQMNSTSEGWDGTLNGEVLPPTDYWFKVVYTEPNSGTVKQFRSHFSKID